MTKIKVSLSKPQINNLRKGKTIQLKPEQMGNGSMNIDLEDANLKKMEKAYVSGKGLRIKLNQREIEGSGFRELFNENRHKSYNDLEDEAVDYVTRKGARIARNLGVSKKTANKFKKTTREVINDNLGKKNYERKKKLKKKEVVSNDENNPDADEYVGSGMSLTEAYQQHKYGKGFLGINKKNIGKTLKSGVNIANKGANYMGYDNIEDMAIDGVTNETIGRIDPNLGHMASNALKKVAKKKLGGSFRSRTTSGGSFKSIGGGLDRGNNKLYDDRHPNRIHPGHPAFAVNLDKRRYFL